MSRPSACLRRTYKSASSAAGAAARKRAKRFAIYSLPAIAHLRCAPVPGSLEAARNQVQIQCQNVQHQADDEHKSDRVQRDDELLVGRPATDALIGQKYNVAAIEQRDR